MDTTPANDNGPLKARDWYSVPTILLVPGEKPQIVACAFYLGRSRSWLPLLAPQHENVVARRKVGRRFSRIV